MAQNEKLNEEGAMNNNLTSSTYMKSEVVKRQDSKQKNGARK